MKVAEKPILGKRLLPEGAVPLGCVSASHHPVSHMSPRSPGCCRPHSQDFWEGPGASRGETGGPWWRVGILRPGEGWLGQMSQQRQGRLMWAQGPCRWAKTEGEEEGQGSREVCQRRGEQVGRGSEWQGEGKVGGRRSRGIDQGRGDPGRRWEGAKLVRGGRRSAHVVGRGPVRSE